MLDAAPVSRPPPAGMVTLRCDLAAPALGAALDRAVGCAAPGVRRIVFGPSGAAAWMGPDELMLFTEAGAAPDACAVLDDALEGLHHLAVDVSDARVLFRLDGAGARETLAKGAPVDLAPGAFGPGDFRRTRLGQVAAALWMREPNAIELLCHRSVADHVALWLATAARPDRLPGLFPTGGR